MHRLNYADDKRFFDSLNAQTHEPVGCAAWHRTSGLEKPLAITGGYIHPRMLNQKSRFTVHGSDREDFRAYFQEHGLVDRGLVKQFPINKSCAKTILPDNVRASP